MSLPPYPRSPKVLLGGIAHLPRMIDKIRLRDAGQIPDYNYLTVGFDKYLLDFLGIPAAEVEGRVLEGGTDDEVLAWVRARARPSTTEALQAFNARILTGEPRDDAARLRFQGRLAEIAAKRGVPVARLPRVTTWAEVIELDEGRL